MPQFIKRQELNPIFTFQKRPQKMEKKKIIFCIIKSLSSEDRADFKQQIRCGKSSKVGERIEKLYSFFEKAVDQDNLDELKPTKLVKSLKISSPKKLSPLYSELIKGLKSFLIFLELQKDELQQQLFLQKALADREEKEYIDILHEEIRDYISAIDSPSPEDFQQQAAFYNSLYMHPNTNTQKREALAYLNRSEVNLETSYWIKKLRILIDKANRGLVIAGEHDLLDELPSLPKLTQYTYNDKTHILSIYEKAYQFILKPFGKDELQEVIDLISTYSSNVSRGDRERIFNYLMSVISYNLPKKGTSLSTFDIYKVYKLAFTNHWLVQVNGLIHFEDLINMLYLAFYYKDINLLESIETEYEDYIFPEYLPFIAMLSRGYNFYLHQQWESVMKVFSNQDLPNIGHRAHFITQRNLIQIKCLFKAFIQEKIELEDIGTFLDKHKRFIQRKAETNSNQTTDRNLYFIKLLRQLHSYLIKRATFGFKKEKAHAEISAWVADVEIAGPKTLDLPWLQQIGETLLQEVQQTSKPNTW